MKNILLATAIAVLLSAGLLQAQCGTCYVVGWVDNPVINTPPPTFSQSATNHVYGWGFRCYDAYPIDRVTGFYRGDDGYFVPFTGLIIVGYGQRPDVAAAYNASCPALINNDWVGVAATFPVANIPVGTRDIIINYWVGPLLNVYQQSRTITVVP